MSNLDDVRALRFTIGLAEMVDDDAPDTVQLDALADEVGGNATALAGMAWALAKMLLVEYRHQYPDAEVSALRTMLAHRMNDEGGTGVDE